MTRRVGVVLVLLCAAAAVWGKIIHVDVNTGSDTADCGTNESPCKTIAYAAQEYSDEDRVDMRIGAGSYDGNVAFANPEVVLASEGAPSAGASVFPLLM